MALNAIDVFGRLHDISQRSQQQTAGLKLQDDSQVRWSAVGFRIGQSQFLVSLDETQEVFTYPDNITPIPNAKEWVSGIANLRGELLPVFDLKYFLHNKSSTLNQNSRIIMMNHPDCNAGLLVDEVYGLHHFDSLPEATNIRLSPYIYGSVFHQNMHWHVFSFNHLAADERFFNVAA